MNTPLQTPTSRPAQNNVNPFARALAEAHGNPTANQTPDDQNNPGADGLRSSDQSQQQQPSPEQLAEQQRQQAEQLKLKNMRDKLHRQINPVEMHDVFKSRESQVKKEIDQLRYELKALSQEIAEFHEEIEVTLMGEVPDAGQQGKYHISFFQQLREWIVMLRQKIHSARTWATQFNQKKKKSRGGMLIDGVGHKETKQVWDRMGQEVSTQYASG